MDEVDEMDGMDAVDGVDPVDLYLGLGANLGDPIAQLRRALGELIQRNLLIEPIRRSSLYRTPPWGTIPNQPWFINAVVCGKTSHEPLPLLDALKAIESDLGRLSRSPRWGTRPIDLDILLHGRIVLTTPDLTIPHLYLTQRAFVLVPLLEIAPELTDPVSGKPYSHFLTALTDDVRKTEKIEETL